MKGRCMALALLGLAAAACGGGDERAERPAGAWVGAITTEGNVTTVVNESGSVWGGTARLVEETSIGVDFGEDEYMLGYVSALLATDSEIFVVDGQVPVVRVYDMQGRYLRDLGGEGQGPGEYTGPSFMAATGDGRVLLLDTPNGRVNIYGPGADDVDSWPLGNVSCCVFPMQLDRSGKLWIETRIVDEETRSSRRAMLAHGPDGAIGEPLMVPEYGYERWTYRLDGREYPVPMTTAVHWNIHPDGAMVAGTSDRYRFEILYPDGKRTVVEKYWDPVPYTAAESEYWRRITQEQITRRSGGSDGGGLWDGAFPEAKPAFMRFQVAATGEILVARENPAEIVAGCEPDPAADRNDYELSSEGYRLAGTCFVLSYTVDVFSPDGRYLGAFEIPQLHPYSFIRGDMILTPEEDEAGVVMVKRYRLALPGEVS